MIELKKKTHKTFEDQLEIGFHDEVEAINYWSKISRTYWDHINVIPVRALIIRAIDDELQHLALLKHLLETLNIDWTKWDV